MKYTKTFRILGMAIILSLLVVAIPATPALAQTIYCSPSSGSAGTTVAVGGWDYTAYANQTVYILFDNNFIVSAVVSRFGTFDTSFTVPATYTTAMTVYVTVQHTTKVYDATKAITIASFRVTVRQISISPSSGYVGDEVTVNGNGFNASSSVTIYFDAAAVSTATTNADGSFSGATFTVPEIGGTHTVKGSDASGDSSGVSFTTLSKIAVTPTSGVVGDGVKISGSGFAASSGIIFNFDDVSVSAGATTTNANGSFTNNTFAIPLSSWGSHTIKAKDASGNYATATFTIAEKITITPPSAVSGTTVAVTGTGFSASKPITIKYNAVAVATTPAVISTDAKGSFTASFNVPAGAPGTYSVEVTDGTCTDSASFTAIAEATISRTTSEASPGYVGMKLTITGTGFKPNATVTITYTTKPVVLATATTDENGAFSVTVNIPPGARGNHTITVTDGHATQQFTFVMESQAPPIPTPLLPEPGTEVKSEAYFDWEDVEDPSGVTYTLCIVSDANFTTTVLEKKGLTNSEYTLTEEEKLESVSKKEPYYWSVKAIDGASNQSQWATGRSFYVGSFFTMPTWAIYLLFGLGALLLGVLGFWLRRRTVQG